MTSAFHPYVRNKSISGGGGNQNISAFLLSLCENEMSTKPTSNFYSIASPPPSLMTDGGAVVAAPLQPPPPVPQPPPPPPPPPPSSTERSRRKRTTFSPDQANRLEQEYLNDCYMAREKRIILAVSLNLSENQVKTWFQNRRAKDKRDRKTDNSPLTTSRKTSPSRSIPSPNSSTSSASSSFSSSSSNAHQLLTSPIVVSPPISTKIIEASSPTPSTVKASNNNNNNVIIDYAAYLQALGISLNNFQQQQPQLLLNNSSLIVPQTTPLSELLAAQLLSSFHAPIQSMSI